MAADYADLRSRNAPGSAPERLRYVLFLSVAVAALRHTLMALSSPTAASPRSSAISTRLLEQLEPRLVMDSQWQNPARPLDVNNNGSVAPLDALLVINKLNSSGSTQLPPRTNPLDYYYDTSGDGVLSPRDALLIINDLNVNGSSTDLGSRANRRQDQRAFSACR